MVVGYCENCKYFALVSDNSECNCPRCSGIMRSLGINSMDWNELPDEDKYDLSKIAEKVDQIRKREEEKKKTITVNAKVPEKDKSQDDLADNETNEYNKIVAYIDSNAMEILSESEQKVYVKTKLNIAVEFIDAAPLTAEVVYTGDDAEITIFARNEMHTNSTIAHHGVEKGGEISVDKGDANTVKTAIDVAEGINRYLNDRNMVEECSGLNNETQGVLFEVKNNEVVAQIVEGKKRPALLCTALFGAPHMVRPYTDEIMDQFAIDGLSIEELEEVANNGDTAAMERLALTYLNGDDEVLADPKKAFDWYVKLAETGDDEAIFNVGLFTAKGYGTDRDFSKAADWMQRAADKGDTDAETCAIEYRKIAKAMEKAKTGDAQAQADLAAGLMKMGGSLEQAGASKDYEDSVMWAEKAVAQGNADGYWALALAYHHGRGVKKDIQKAIELYEKGAEAGSDACKHNLACEYMNGANIPKDMHRGFELVKEAAENGYGLAMRDLGRCYQFASGTPGNMKKAVEWYEKALEVIDDPELAQKTAMFKSLADVDPSFGEEYPENESDTEDDKKVEDATDTIRKGLEVLGKSSDDKSLSDLSIKDAYAAYFAAMGQNTSEETTDPGEGKKKSTIIFNGKNFVLSGFDSFTEPPIREIIEKKGGIVRSSTVMDTDYLIYDERFGVGTKKHERALELNRTKGKDIKIIPLKEFRSIANMESSSSKISEATGNNDESLVEKAMVDEEPTVGKAKDLSDEEILAAAQNGQGVIKQIVALPDGSKKEIAVWGGYELDGYDRTMNVFMNNEDMGTFVHIAIDSIKENESLVDPCKDEEGVQVTVDFMDMAATLIYRQGHGKVSTEMYVRDERKTCQTLVETGTGEIETNEDGKLSLEGVDLKSNKYLVFVLTVVGVRRYLIKEGIAQKLYDMFDESAGVVIKVSQSGNISAKIVKGMERPDLPCEIFLLGRQMCRPYIDEMLGLKSSGIRKPRDPEFAEKMRKLEEEEAKRREADKKKKATEEKLRKAKEEAEQKQKAKEERERREKEEAKKKAEEEARIKAEKEALERVKKELPEKREYFKYASGLMGASMNAFVGVKPDGTVLSFSNFTVWGKGAPGDTSRFRDIKSVVCTWDGIVGLRNDGTCIATDPGQTYSYIKECNSWKNIISISAGNHHVIGLRADGTCIGNTIVANTGYGDEGQTNVAGWRDIVQIACAHNHTLGLRKDGSVILACNSEYCKVKGVTNWKDVEMIATEQNGAVGLTRDGKLLTAGSVAIEGIQTSKGIIQMVINRSAVYALYADGTVGVGKKERMISYNIKESNVIALKSERSTLYVLTEDGNIKIYGADSSKKIPSEIRLFTNYSTVMSERVEEERKRKQEEELKAERREQGKCQHCGGEFKKGVFATKCLSCGKNKDY